MGEFQVRSTCDGNTSAYSSSSLFTTTNSTILHQGYFESGWDGWVSGGSDALRYTSGTYSYENQASIYVRDDTGANARVTSPTFDLSSYDSVNFSFYYYPNSMETDESFILQYFNGTVWQTIKTYVSETDFTNGSFYNEDILLEAPTYTMASNARFRIECMASANQDQIYIDQVVITGNQAQVLSNSDIDFESQLKIYPNPFNTELLINVAQNISYSTLKISMFDLSGRKLMSKKYDNNFSDIKLNNLNDLSSGTYFILLEDKRNGIKAIKKLIKQ